MNMLCTIFGHRQYSGWWGDGLYGNLVLGDIDGMGRQHAHISIVCDRCGKRYVRARFHMSSGRQFAEDL